MATIVRQPAFILHRQEWDDKTEQVELLTPDHGRLLVYTRKSRLQLPVFQEIQVDLRAFEDSWKLASWITSGKLHYLSKQYLFYGLYMNELMVRLVPRQDANPLIFGLYSSTLTLISKRKDDFAALTSALRFYERRLLEELGYGISFIHDADQKPILDDQYYWHVINSGFKLVAQGVPDLVNKPEQIPGDVLLAINKNDFADRKVASVARIIMSREIDSHLNGHELNSRILIRQHLRHAKNTASE